jgi:hypothetical protein
MLKRYLIFAHNTDLNLNNGGKPFYNTPRGGFGDFVGDFDELEDFKTFLPKLTTKTHIEVVDTTFPKYAIIPFKGAIWSKRNIDLKYDEIDLFSDFMNNRLTENTLFDR